jgi:hypothetical protein
MDKVSLIKWFGTFCFITAALLLSANFEGSRYGFLIFLVGHIILTHLFYKMRDYPLTFQNGFFIIVDVFGIYRWFF